MERFVTGQAESEPAPLWKAARDGDVARIQQLLDAKAPVDEQLGTEKATPLMYAAGFGRLDAVKMLIKAGARLDLRDSWGQAALWSAVRLDRFDCVTELLAAGADSNVRTNYGQTPLIVAAELESTRCLVALLEKHPDLNAVDNVGFSALMRAAWVGRFENVKALLKAGADIDLENSDGETALVKAGQRGNEGMVIYLTQAGAKKTKVFLNECLERDQTLTPAQRWAIATTALLTQYNGYSLETLAVGKESRAVWLKSLQNDWGVNSRTDLFTELNWLSSHLDFPDSPEGREHLAWNLCRYIFLARTGYTAGYLSSDEAWQKIPPIAQRIQRSYHSWEELEGDYLAWREKGHWVGAPAFRSIYKLMLCKDDPNSPWNISPWDTPLGEASK
jgi:hypothetical protein